MAEHLNRLAGLADWVLRELGPDVPLHFTAYHPDWKLTDAPPTPPATLARARSIARHAGLRYVYTGNVHDSEGGTTFCPTCQKALVVRDWYEIGRYEISADGSCPGCGRAIAGRFGRYERPFGAHRIPVRIGVA